MTGFARQVAVAGVGYGEVGRDVGQSDGKLALTAVVEAVRDAGLDMADVDGVTAFPERVLSSFEGPPISYLQRSLGNPRTTYVQAFGSGGTQLSAVSHAAYAIACGAADVVVCVRAHQRQRARHSSRMSGGAVGTTGPAIWDVPFGVPGGAPRYALWATRHIETYGVTAEQLGSVVLLCRANAQLNPRAVWNGTPLTMEDYLASDLICSPFRLLDCDFPVDGAVAVVLTRADRAADLRHLPVHIESIGHATGRDSDFYAWDDMTTMAAAHAGDEMWRRTELRPSDVDVAEVYDGFSWLALAWLEDLGFCAKGEAGAMVQSGACDLDGTLPICTDGGQLGIGRLHGFGKLAEAVEQLRGEAGPRQVPNAEVAVACSGGGPGATAILLTR